MMNRAGGPVWHKNRKDKGIIPKGLRGIGKEAARCESESDGRIYGYGSFSLSSHNVVVLGCFMRMKNSGHEAKRMWFETSYYQGIAEYIVMDSEADDYGLFGELRRQSKMTLITECRNNMIKTQERRKMSVFMEKHKKMYRERSHTVEPMRGLVRNISDLSECRMYGSNNNRWIFASMGLTVQMYQLKAYRENRSTFKIKDDVLG